MSTSDRGATSESNNGLTRTLNNAMSDTAITASSTRMTAMPGRMKAVAMKATVATSSVMTIRFVSAHGPPRQFHRIRTWVRYRLSRLVMPANLSDVTGRRGPPP